MTNLRELGICADYMNENTHYVSVIMYSSIPNDPNVIKRIPEVNGKQTLRINTGSVTHSGPGGQAMEDVYYRFFSVYSLCNR